MNNNINPKYIAAKKALISARDLDISRKENLERELSEMEKASSMPIEVLKTHIWNIYKEKEPERVQSCIDTALRTARGSSITDKHSMNAWLGYAQEHSEIPLAQSVIDHVNQEYQKHEPQRKYEALKTALRTARGSSITDKNSMNAWLGYAQRHSHGPKDKFLTLLLGLGIKGRYALRPVLRR
ncbi:MAG: hypothetical protein KJ685_03630 [Nanoarchaeota archaeon]|nr:hypothetical protein [Nanoarchaeota archaeon]MBU2441654.1 hypothetical protein [Nanoarchaeota archaeon]